MFFLFYAVKILKVDGIPYNRTLRSHDISDIVCLLTETEFRKFRVPDLLNDYENAGFIVYHLPIEDGKSSRITVPLLLVDNRFSSLPFVDVKCNFIY